MVLILFVVAAVGVIIVVTLFIEKCDQRNLVSTGSGRNSDKLLNTEGLLILSKFVIHAFNFVFKVYAGIYINKTKY